MYLFNIQCLGNKYNKATMIFPKNLNMIEMHQHIIINSQALNVLNIFFRKLGRTSISEGSKLSDILYFNNFFAISFSEPYLIVRLPEYYHSKLLRKKSMKMTTKPSNI